MPESTSDIDIAAKARVLAEMGTEVIRHQTIARECLSPTADGFHIAMHERAAELYAEQILQLHREWYLEKGAPNAV